MTEPIVGPMTMAQLQERLRRGAERRREELVPLDEADRVLGIKQRRQNVRDKKLEIVRAVRRGAYEDCREDAAERCDGPPSNLWSREEAAKHCDCHVETISRWARDDEKLPVAYWHNKRPYFDPEDVQHALRAAQQGRRMDYRTIEELTSFRMGQIRTLMQRRLFPRCNRDQKFRTSEVYDWFERFQANPEAPFDDAEKDARFRDTLSDFKRDDAARKAWLDAYAQRQKAEAEARRRAGEELRQKARRARPTH
jgi:hypothetical protein